jgi:hypothetical protein
VCHDKSTATQEAVRSRTTHSGAIEETPSDNTESLRVSPLTLSIGTSGIDRDSRIERARMARDDTKMFFGNSPNVVAEHTLGIQSIEPINMNEGLLSER